MNKFIKEQLQLCKIANIPEFDDDTTQISIYGKRKPVELVMGLQYRIELENYIVNPPPNFDLADNWNNGTKPTDVFMNVMLVQTFGEKMIKIEGTCLSDNKFWSGWVPKKSIKSIKEI